MATANPNRTCAKCNNPLKDKMTSAMGRRFHPECFVCTTCNKPFEKGAFQTKDSKAYCTKCYSEKFETGNKNCKKCGQDLGADSYITALGGVWHNACFKCDACNVLLENGAFFVKKKKPHCQKCAGAGGPAVTSEEMKNIKCHKCGGAFDDGAIVDAMEKKWHTKCFICIECKKPIGTRSFSIKDGVPFCRECYSKKFQPDCQICNQKVKAGTQYVTVGDKSFHKVCFKCHVCSKSLADVTFVVKNGKYQCPGH